MGYNRIADILSVAAAIIPMPTLPPLPLRLLPQVLPSPSLTLPLPLQDCTSTASSSGSASRTTTSSISTNDTPIATGGVAMCLAGAAGCWVSPLPFAVLKLI